MWEICFICTKPAAGFGWRHPDNQQAKRHFCSMVCQGIHYQLYKAEVVVNRTDLEQQATESVLGPLADYVVTLGMDKGLGHYSKAEIQGLIDTVLDSYQQHLQQLYKEEVPF